MELRHGYTMDDLNRLARTAAFASATAGDLADRCETAWLAIAEDLYRRDGPPPSHALVQVGKMAIFAAIDDARHHHGFYQYKTIGGRAGPGSSPRWVAYWQPVAGTVPSHESAVVERRAVDEILAALTPRQRESLAALASFGNLRSAADALGIGHDAFRALIGRARNEFRRLWHEGEVPSRPWGRDRRINRYGQMGEASVA